MFWLSGLTNAQVLGFALLGAAGGAFVPLCALLWHLLGVLSRALDVVCAALDRRAARVRTINAQMDWSREAWLGAHDRRWNEQTQLFEPLFEEETRP